MNHGKIIIQYVRIIIKHDKTDKNNYVRRPIYRPLVAPQTSNIINEHIIQLKLNKIAGPIIFFF